MKAWKIEKFGGVDVMQLDTDFPQPEVRPTDLLVRNYAIGSNPVDFKVREGRFGGNVSATEPLVLGWDAAGVVEQVGDEVVGFQVGDEVYYSGDITRPVGSYAEFTAVDYRIVGRKPATLSWTDAAVVPLVALTVYETLVEDMHVEEGNSILVLNGAGGLGSMAVQMAKLKGLVVVGTASRPETEKWVRDQGADYVINHHQPLAPQLHQLGFPKGVDYILHCHDAGKEYGELIANCLKPFGKIAVTLSVLEGALESIDRLELWKQRKQLLHTFMFARAIYGVEMERQGRLLNEVAGWVDEGKIHANVTKLLRFEEMKQAMELQASGKTMGKIAISCTPIE